MDNNLKFRKHTEQQLLMQQAKEKINEKNSEAEQPDPDLANILNFLNNNFTDKPKKKVENEADFSTPAIKGNTVTISILQKKENEINLLNAKIAAKKNKISLMKKKIEEDKTTNYKKEMTFLCKIRHLRDALVNEAAKLQRDEAEAHDV